MPGRSSKPVSNLKHKDMRVSLPTKELGGFARDPSLDPRWSGKARTNRTGSRWKCLSSRSRRLTVNDSNLRLYVGVTDQQWHEFLAATPGLDALLPSILDKAFKGEL
jgi:hypothetical protein